jgi:hypothetical protein
VRRRASAGRAFQIENDALEVRLIEDLLALGSAELLDRTPACVRRVLGDWRSSGGDRMGVRVRKRRFLVNTEMLSDFDHPAVQSRAKELTSGRPTLLDKTESLFGFVRDEIRLGFPPKWDEVRASETLQYEMGYCNTKATLFLALCKAAGIPARIHTGLIDIEIMRGIFPPFAFPFLPSAGGHTWMEIEIAGEWMPMDSYINDRDFYQGAVKRLQTSGKTTAFSISHAKGPSSCEFNFGEKGFVQMGAVVEDHGTWHDYSEYMSSEKYSSMNRMQLMAYPLIAWLSNRNIERIRG